MADEVPAEQPQPDPGIEESQLYQPVSESDSLRMCESLLGAGYHRSHIAYLMNRSDAWVSQSLALLEHPDLVAKIEAGLLTRTVAIGIISAKRVVTL